MFALIFSFNFTLQSCHICFGAHVCTMCTCLYVCKGVCAFENNFAYVNNIEVYICVFFLSSFCRHFRVDIVSQNYRTNGKTIKEVNEKFNLKTFQRNNYTNYITLYMWSFLFLCSFLSLLVVPLLQKHSLFLLFRLYFTFIYICSVYGRECWLDKASEATSNQ